MATKIFTTIPGRCPFGYKNDIDDHLCRLCPFYYRAGTGTFFWCNHPPKEKQERKTAEIVPEQGQEKRKRGRPPGKATKTPVKRTKPKKR